jgi:hypothetical protein
VALGRARATQPHMSEEEHDWIAVAAVIVFAAALALAMVLA